MPKPLVPGNINLYSRPQVKNQDGSTSTVRSMGIGVDAGEALIPTVIPDAGGRYFTDEAGDQSVAHYDKTGQHLGIFGSPAAATSYSKDLHNSYAAGDLTPPLASSRKSVNPERLNSMLRGLMSAGPYALPNK